MSRDGAFLVPRVEALAAFNLPLGSHFKCTLETLTNASNMFGERKSIRKVHSDQICSSISNLSPVQRDIVWRLFKSMEASVRGTHDGQEHDEGERCIYFAFLALQILVMGSHAPPRLARDMQTIERWPGIDTGASSSPSGAGSEGDGDGGRSSSSSLHHGVHLTVSIPEARGPLPTGAFSATSPSSALSPSAASGALSPPSTAGSGTSSPVSPEFFADWIRDNAKALLALAPMDVLTRMLVSLCRADGAGPNESDLVVSDPSVFAEMIRYSDPHCARAWMSEFPHPSLVPFVTAVRSGGNVTCAVENVRRRSFVLRESDACGGQEMGGAIFISRCIDAHVYVPACAGIIVVSECEGSTITVGCASQILRVERCDRCTVIGVGRETLISSCFDTVFHLGTLRPPLLLGENMSLVLAPYHTYYPRLTTHLASAGLPPEKLSAAYADPISFGSPSPDGTKTWRAMDESEFFPFAIPFGESSGPCQRNPIPLPPKYARRLTALQSTAEETANALDATEMSDRKRVAVQAALQSSFRAWLMQTGQMRQVNDLVSDA